MRFHRSLSIILFSGTSLTFPCHASPLPAEPIPFERVDPPPNDTVQRLQDELSSRRKDIVVQNFFDAYRSSLKGMDPGTDAALAKTIQELGALTLPQIQAPSPRVSVQDTLELIASGKECTSRQEALDRLRIIRSITAYGFDDPGANPAPPVPGKDLYEEYQQAQDILQRIQNTLPFCQDPDLISKLDATLNEEETAQCNAETKCPQYAEMMGLQAQVAAYETQIIALAADRKKKHLENVQAALRVALQSIGLGPDDADTHALFVAALTQDWLATHAGPGKIRFMIDNGYEGLAQTPSYQDPSLVTLTQYGAEQIAEWKDQDGAAVFYNLPNGLKASAANPQFHARSINVTKVSQIFSIMRSDDDDDDRQFSAMNDLKQAQIRLSSRIGLIQAELGPTIQEILTENTEIQQLQDSEKRCKTDTEKLLGLLKAFIPEQATLDSILQLNALSVDLDQAQTEIRKALGGQAKIPATQLKWH